MIESVECPHCRNSSAIPLAWDVWFCGYCGILLKRQRSREAQS